MITDSFFHQGESHEVCEDYALHGPYYTVVSDGCSNMGGPRLDTDWGSRILSKAAELHMDVDDPKEFTSKVAQTAKQNAEHLGMPNSCLTATLLCAKKCSSKFTIYAVGDGFFGGRNKDKTWDIFQILYPSGAPFYLKYFMDEQCEIYQKMYGFNFEIIHSKILPDQIVQEVEKFEVDPANPQYLFDFDAEAYDTVFVASDGMEHFRETIVTDTQKHTEMVSPLSVLDIILDVLEFRPGFLKLQHNWAFKQKRKGTFCELNWRPGDDVSIGMIHEN